MKEKQIQTLFGKNNVLYGAFELKLCKKKSIPFKAVEDHQIKALTQCEEEGIYHKIADMTFGRNGFGNSLKKPFDCFQLPPLPAYVVIVFYVPRKRKTAYYIPVKNFISLRDSAGRKSATESMCELASTAIINLK